MKKNQYVGLLTFGAMLLGAVAPLHANGRPGGDNSTVGGLEVDVQLPPSWSASLHGDHVSELFSHRVADEFRRMGFEGKIRYVRGLEEAETDGYRLVVRLIDWRLNAVGNVDCSFTAELTTPGGERSLGMFAATALHSVTGRGHLWLGDSFEDAADQAIGDLYRELAKLELIPGLRDSS